MDIHLGRALWIPGKPIELRGAGSSAGRGSAHCLLLLHGLRICCRVSVAAVGVTEVRHSWMHAAETSSHLFGLFGEAAGSSGLGALHLTADIWDCTEKGSFYLEGLADFCSTTLARGLLDYSAGTQALSHTVEAILGSFAATSSFKCMGGFQAHSGPCQDPFQALPAGFGLTGGTPRLWFKASRSTSLGPVSRRYLLAFWTGPALSGGGRRMPLRFLTRSALTGAGLDHIQAHGICSGRPRSYRILKMGLENWISTQLACNGFSRCSAWPGMKPLHMD